jgi:hypothetical protein
MQLIRLVEKLSRASLGYLIGSALFLGWQLLALNVYAQSKPKNTFLQLASGGGTFSFYDSGQSPRLYSGLVLSGTAAGRVVRPNRISDFQFTALMGSGDNGLNSQWGAAQADMLGFQFVHSEQWRIYKAKSTNLSWWMGPAAQFYNRISTLPALGNNAMGYDLYGGLGLGNRFEYAFKLPSTKTYSWWIFSWKRSQYRPMRLGWETTLPLFAWVLRPTYTGIGNSIHLPATELTRDFLQQLRFSWPGQAGALRSHLYLVYGLHNGNSLQLSWQWNGFYYGDNGDFSAARSANSFFQLGLHIKLDNNKSLWP